MTLTQVMRQLTESGILYNATTIRCKLIDLRDGQESLIVADEEGSPSSIIDHRSSPDVCRLPGDELVESLTTAYSRWGADDCMIICRSNKRANIYNQGIRNMILNREEELTSGDRIMIVKNNYYWIERLVREQHQAQPLSFIANGDIAVVRRVRRTRELYGFRFADALLSFPDYDDYEIETTILLDTLHSESPSLSREESERLFREVEKDYLDIKSKIKRLQEIRCNDYYNALQIKFAYAVTCHKAQGGQWKAVFIDRCLFGDEPMTKDMLRWLYTALTRATEKLYLVNFDERFFE
jgi:exodeoxyribonuclease-5